MIIIYYLSLIATSCRRRTWRWATCAISINAAQSINFYMIWMCCCDNTTYPETFTWIYEAPNKCINRIKSKFHLLGLHASKYAGCRLVSTAHCSMNNFPATEWRSQEKVREVDYSVEAFFLLLPFLDEKEISIQENFWMCQLNFP